MKKIYIDAGHNFSDFNTGAMGNGMREQDITFEVAFLLGEVMGRHGLDVLLSRPAFHTNLGHNSASAINARWQEANRWGADYFVSIHTNAGGGIGAETLFYREQDRSFAQRVQDIYTEEMGLRNRRIWRRDDVAVVRFTNMPAILVELAFIDAPRTAPDVDILRNHRPKIAEALAKSILTHIDIPYVAVVPLDDPPSQPNTDTIPQRFQTIPEMPHWARPTLAMLVEEGHLNGIGDIPGENLDLSYDMIRTFVVFDRAGAFD